MSTNLNIQNVEKIDLKKYMLIMRRRLWWAVVPFLLLLGIFLLIFFAIPPKYEADCTIKASKSEVAEYLGAGTTKVASSSIVQDEMLLYGRVMEALRNTDVYRDIEQRTENDPMLRLKLLDELHKQVKQNIRIYSSSGGIIINVSYYGNTDAEAYNILNGLVNHFVENALAKERSVAEEARKLANDEVKTSKDSLDRLEQTLQTFMQDHPKVVIGTSIGDTHKTIGDLQRERDTIKREMDAKTKEVARLTEEILELPEQEIEVIETITDPAVLVNQTRLAELRSQLALSLKKYTPAHPTVKELEKQIAAAEENLAKVEGESEDRIKMVPHKEKIRLRQLKDQLEARLDELKAIHQSQSQQLIELTQEAQNLPDLQRTYNRLKRETSNSLERYERSLQRARRIEDEHRATISGLVSFSIIQPVRMPQTKTIRHKIKILLVGLFFSIAAAIVGVAGTEFFDQSFTDIESARDFLKIPSLGTIPYIATRRDRREIVFKYLLILAIIFGLVAVAFTLIIMFPDDAREYWMLFKELVKNLS